MQPLSPTLGVILEASGAGVLPDAAHIAGLFNRHRCVLLRGFGATVEQFEQASASLTGEFLTYRGGALTGGSARSAIKNNNTLMTASGGTQEDRILLHGEMYYQAHPPDVLWFYCANPSAQGGETTVADGVALFNDLPARTARAFTKRRICYQRRLADGDWQRSFQTDSREEVEAYCQSEQIALSWTAEGEAVTRFCRSALQVDAAGNLSFINLLLLLAMHEDRSVRARLSAALLRLKGTFPLGFSIRWEEGSLLPRRVIEDVREASERQEVAVAWKRGDILLVDNRSVMHGRRASSGGSRQILVRMGHLRPEFSGKTLIA